ncbi:Homeo [Glarea lozoyensis ATCC 20868]|uniref:Homeo n=1 Tax=Glarea lozoyensis (strain ATCC 20868 / MF5171) TaxID=1116229 RepID=S3CSI6_GLAL2|nr:Homeo [Glarea lozoyensis ATCC 20868]EPE28630.1 Homeo [Glarea lozoyensis ATCC 20868]
MSTNEQRPDNKERVGYSTSLSTETTSTSSSVMGELPPSRAASRSIPPSPYGNMSVLTLQQHNPQHYGRQTSPHGLWNFQQESNYHHETTQPRLPTIATAIGLEYLNPRPEPRPDVRTTYSPVVENQPYPAYIPSPNTRKRARPYCDQEIEAATPRTYHAPSHASPRPQSGRTTPITGPYDTFNHGNWDRNGREKSKVNFSPVRTLEPEKRTLPALPGLKPHTRAESLQPTRMYDYNYEPVRETRTYPQMLTAPLDPPPVHNQYTVPTVHQRSASFAYHPQQANQYYSPIQHHSVPYAPSQERTPFSSNPQHLNTYSNGHSYGANEPPNETAPRRRRGNLPKEVTEILREWFHSHLHRPYPTEEEKLELMARTGLQINQVSNWYINARRRQLPGLISDANAERARMAAQSNVVYGRTDSISDVCSSEGEFEPDFKRPRRVSR